MFRICFLSFKKFLFIKQKDNFEFKRNYEVYKYSKMIKRPIYIYILLIIGRYRPKFRFRCCFRLKILISPKISFWRKCCRKFRRNNLYYKKFFSSFGIFNITPSFLLYEQKMRNLLFTAVNIIFFSYQSGLT